MSSALGTELPVRLRAWDGSETGPPGTPCVVLRPRRALRLIMWSPGELGLAPAYVTGDLDVEGDVEEGFRLVWAAARDRGAPASSVPGERSTLSPTRSVWARSGRRATSGSRSAARRAAA